MSWGVPRRPKVSNKLGAPDPREGGDGDIQVRQTSIGAKIFAKLGGRWLSAQLGRDDSPAVPVKTHYFSFQMEAGEVEELIPLPDWINSGSVVGIIFMPNHSADYWYIDNWADLVDDPEAGSKVTRYRAVYDRTNHRIQVDRMGSQIDDGKWAKITILYV